MLMLLLCALHPSSLQVLQAYKATSIFYMQSQINTLLKSSANAQSLRNK